MRQTHLPFKIVAIALFIGLILPVLIQDGMFMDGMLYTCVAKNLGNDIGTFWHPVSYETWNIGGVPTFHEHPPLVFGIQSVFYKIFGNSMYVERFYTLLTALISAFLIILIWRETFKNNKVYREYYWLPIILWIIVPVAHWSFQNNMMENTMGIFSLLAVYILLKSYTVEKLQILYIIAGAVFIFLATFSKGVPGLFPLVVIGIHWLVFRKISFLKTVLYTLILIAVPVLIYYILIQNPNAKDALSFYVFERLLHRTEALHTVSKRFYLIIALISQLLPALILLVILIFVFWRKKFQNIWEEKKNFIFFLLVGLSGSLPLMLTKVQKDFYFSHTVSFFAISFALLILPGLHKLFKQIKVKNKGYKIFKGISFILLIVALSLTVVNIGGISREKDLIEDMRKIAAIVPENTIVRNSKDLAYNYNFKLYLVRNYYISSTIYDDIDYEYFISTKLSPHGEIDKYKKIDLKTENLDLYRLKQTD